jgi:hypothetical protein
MKSTSNPLDAFLQCPTKGRPRARNEVPGGNTNAEWVRLHNEFSHAARTERL